MPFLKKLKQPTQVYVISVPTYGLQPSEEPQGLFFKWAVNTFFISILKAHKIQDSCPKCLAALAEGGRRRKWMLVQSLLARTGEKSGEKNRDFFPPLFFLFLAGLCGIVGEKKNKKCFIFGLFSVPSITSFVSSWENEAG